MYKKILFIILILLFSTNVFAWQQTVGSSTIEQTTDKLTMNKPFIAPFKVLSLTATCTIGTDCDGTAVDIANNGLILATTNAFVVTLPEIASSPSVTQVPIGASICFVVRDNNKVLTITANAADSITLAGTKGDVGHTIINTVTAGTGAGNYVCLIAVELDNWMVTGTIGTWTAPP